VGIGATRRTPLEIERFHRRRPLNIPRTAAPRSGRVPLTGGGSRTGTHRATSMVASIFADRAADPGTCTSRRGFGVTMVKPPVHRRSQTDIAPVLRQHRSATEESRGEWLVPVEGVCRHRLFGDRCRSGPSADCSAGDARIRPGQASRRRGSRSLLANEAGAGHVRELPSRICRRRSLLTAPARDRRLWRCRSRHA
jgi:hypothetical protein